MLPNTINNPKDSILLNLHTENSRLREELEQLQDIETENNKLQNELELTRNLLRDAKATSAKDLYTVNTELENVRRERDEINRKLIETNDSCRESNIQLNQSLRDRDEAIKKQHHLSKKLKDFHNDFSKREQELLEHLEQTHTQLNDELQRSKAINVDYLEKVGGQEEVIASAQQEIKLLEEDLTLQRNENRKLLDVIQSLKETEESSKMKINEITRDNQYHLTMEKEHYASEKKRLVNEIQSLSSSVENLKSENERCLSLLDETTEQVRELEKNEVELLKNAEMKLITEKKNWEVEADDKQAQVKREFEESLRNEVKLKTAVLEELHMLQIQCLELEKEKELLNTKLKSQNSKINDLLIKLADEKTKSQLLNEMKIRDYDAISSEKSRLVETLTDLKGDMQRISIEKSEMLSEITSLQEEIRNTKIIANKKFESMTQNHKAEVSRLNVQSEEVRAEYDKLLQQDRQKILCLEKENKCLNEANDMLSKDIEKFKVTIEELKTNYKQYQQQLLVDKKKLQSVVENLKDEIKCSKVEFRNQLNEKEEKNNEVEELFKLEKKKMEIEIKKRDCYSEDLKKENMKLTEEIDALKASCVTYEKEIGIMEMEVKRYHDDQMHLNSIIVCSKNELKQLQDKFDDLNKVIETLKFSVTEKENINSTLEKELSSLQKGIRDNQNEHGIEINTLNEKIDDLESTNIMLHDIIHTNEKDFISERTALISQIDNLDIQLNSNIETYNRDLAKLQRINCELEQKLNKLSESENRLREEYNHSTADLQEKLGQTVAMLEDIEKQKFEVSTQLEMRRREISRLTKELEAWKQQPFQLLPAAGTKKIEKPFKTEAISSRTNSRNIQLFHSITNSNRCAGMLPPLSPNNIIMKGGVHVVGKQQLMDCSTEGEIDHQ